MTRPFLLPLRWYARPALLLVGACLGAALALQAGSLRAGQTNPPSLFAQATAADPDLAEQAIARAERVAGPAAHRLSDDELRAMLAREGAMLPAGALPLLPMIEVRGADEATIAALARLPGIAVDRARAADGSGGGGSPLLAATLALLLAITALIEIRAQGGTVRLLRQLGLARGVALAHPLAAAGGSLALGIAAGALLVWVTGA